MSPEAYSHPPVCSGVYLAFEKGSEEHVTLTATTDCLVYQWSIDDLDYLATRCAPVMPAFWRSYALCQVPAQSEQRGHPTSVLSILPGRGRLSLGGLLPTSPGCLPCTTRLWPCRCCAAGGVGVACRREPVQAAGERAGAARSGGRARW